MSPLSLAAIFKGKVTAINQSIDPNSRIFILQARFDNP